MQNVAIIGGGYAGVQAARRLSVLLEPSWSIMLVERNNCHQLISRLPQVLDGRTSPERACIPFSKILDRRVSTQQTQVKCVDPAGGLINLSGTGLSADWALICCGSAANYGGIPGATRHSLAFKSVEDAVALRRLIESLRASKSVVTTVIVGAGYTATEVAGPLADWDRSLVRTHATSRIRVHLKEFRPHELGEALLLGRHDGVARLGALIIRGRAAGAIKQAALLRYLGSLGGRSLLSRYS